ncbi:hypothetical protein ACFVG9_26885 [Saccharothrix carnea]|nr:hypothetical protein A6A25_31130 [Saccharothrix sp. CB00851]
MDNEPLWSPVEQVYWLFTRAPEATLLPVYRISNRLKIQQPVVVDALRELVTQGRAHAVAGHRYELWGTPERAKQWTNDEPASPRSS